MNKKNIAFILIGLIVVGAIAYFIFGKKKQTLPEADLTSPFDVDDEEGFQKILLLLPLSDRAWVTELAVETFNNGSCIPYDLIGGKCTKVSALTRTISNCMPNAKGTFPSVPWGGGLPSLWSMTVSDQMTAIQNNLKTKYPNFKTTK